MRAARYRPPAEADSLILLIASGCPNNTCAFCGMYKGQPYEIRPWDELSHEFESAARFYPDTRRIFLADGDVMALPFPLFQQILLKLNALFPLLSRVNIYANSISINAKSIDELQTLRALKLSIAYTGIESGSDAILELMKKKDRAIDALDAAEKLQKAGIRQSVMVLMGAGGQALSEAHVRDTARVLNKMQPPLLSLLTVTPVPGTMLYQWVEKGTFRVLTQGRVLGEVRTLLSLLEMERTVFRCNHTSNPLPLEGRLPKDTGRLIAEVDWLLANGVGLDEPALVAPWML
ncbi:MAG: radical SAM protein [Fibrobacterota bacterium]